MSDLKTIYSKDHPHYNESGWLDTESQVETGQYYFKLSNCQHGKSGCYVLPEDLEQTAIEGEIVSSGKRGRPTQYTEEAVRLFEFAFGEGYNISQACQYVGISRETYYAWLEQHDGFSDKMEWAKGKMNRLAKEAVRDALKAKDPNTARWFLDRRDPDFKPKTEVTPNLGAEQTRNKIKEFLDEPSDDDHATGEPPASESNAGGTEPSAPASPEGGTEVAPATPVVS
jgi:transposase